MSSYRTFKLSFDPTCTQFRIFPRVVLKTFNDITVFMFAILSYIEQHFSMCHVYFSIQRVVT